MVEPRIRRSQRLDACVALIGNVMQTMRMIDLTQLHPELRVVIVVADLSRHTLDSLHEGLLQSTEVGRKRRLHDRRTLAGHDEAQGTDREQEPGVDISPQDPPRSAAA